jgi:hypothetical protein
MGRAGEDRVDSSSVLKQQNLKLDYVRDCCKDTVETASIIL